MQPERARAASQHQTVQHQEVLSGALPHAWERSIGKREDRAIVGHANN
jgi:hypothetical protein